MPALHLSLLRLWKSVKDWVMAISDAFLYEYAVIRYVPRVDREEFVNIGLIMMCKRRRWMRAGIWLDADRLKAFCHVCDIGQLRLQTAFFLRDDVPSRDIPVEERYRWLSAVKSAVIQVSPSHPGILSEEYSESEPNGREQAIMRLDDEFDRLFRELVL